MPPAAGSFRQAGGFFVWAVYKKPDCVLAHSSALFFNDMYRSFAALRMTALRNVVILSAAKDLYEMYTNNILNLSLYLDIMMNAEL